MSHSGKYVVLKQARQKDLSNNDHKVVLGEAVRLQSHPQGLKHIILRNLTLNVLSML